MRGAGLGGGRRGAEVGGRGGLNMSGWGVGPMTRHSKADKHLGTLTRRLRPVTDTTAMGIRPTSRCVPLVPLSHIHTRAHTPTRALIKPMRCFTRSRTATPAHAAPEWCVQEHAEERQGGAGGGARPRGGRTHCGGEAGEREEEAGGRSRGGGAGEGAASYVKNGVVGGGGAAGEAGAGWGVAIHMKNEELGGEAGPAGKCKALYGV